MPQDNNIKELIINRLTKVQYKELKDADLLSNTELYIITDNANYTEGELFTLLEAKQNKLIAGDGITIENNIITINLDDFYTSNAIDELLKEKSDISQTGYNLDYTDNILTIQNINGDELSSVRIVSIPELDNVTINLNNSNQLQSIGEITRNGIPKYTWIGTQEEYNQAKLNGVITEFTEVIITDSEIETITPIAQYDAPTKLSELANDMNFVVQSDLQSVKDELQADIEAGIDDTNLVHKTGNETIEGFKNFKEKIVIENGLNKGRIAHKPVDTSLEDGYIEFGDNTLLYGKQNIQGELFDEKHDIFHAGNLVAGNNITITKNNGVYSINGKAGGGTGGSIDNVDNETIIIQDDGSISAQGVLDQNAEDLTAIKFWSGTLEEYEALGEWDDDTIYNVIDDMIETGGLTELPIASTDTLGGVKVDGNTINITQEGVISANIIKSYNDLTDKPTIPSAYTLPTASTSTLGGVKVDGETITILNGIISATSSTGDGEWTITKVTYGVVLTHKSGLKIQTEEYTKTDSGNSSTVTTVAHNYPQAFSNNNYTLLFNYTVGTYSMYINPNSRSATGYTTSENSVNGTLKTYKYIAIGY